MILAIAVAARSLKNVMGRRRNKKDHPAFAKVV